VPDGKAVVRDFSRDFFISHKCLYLSGLGGWKGVFCGWFSRFFRRGDVASWFAK
jgi:hypothetical protein